MPSTEHQLEGRRSCPCRCGFWQLGLLFVLPVALAGCGQRSGRGDGRGSGGAAAGGSSGPGQALGGSSAAELRAALGVGAALPPMPKGDAPGEAPLELNVPAERGSFRALRPVAVFRRPSLRAPIRGSIARQTRLPRVVTVQGEGCAAGFLKLGPGAFVCRTNLRKDRRAPMGRRQPTLGANRLTPGTYGYIRTGGARLFWTLAEGYAGRGGKPIAQSDTVRWAGKRFFKGMKFWRITSGHFIRGSRVRRFWPSRMKGVDLLRSALRLPLVFMASRRRRRIGEKIPPVDVHDRPGGKVVSTLERYSAHSVDDVVVSGKRRWYRIPGKGWVSSEMVRLARVTTPPGSLHPAERWIDVDTEEQTLVAYRGRRPVYVALVSTGVWKYPSPLGTFRVYKKMAEANMKSDSKASESYRVDNVPWTMYFLRGYAMHGAYWHDGFGHARSHGCINLSPRDARVIYHFVRPAMPDGWTSLVADPAHRGTLVRIRGKSGVKPAEPPSRSIGKKAMGVPSLTRPRSREVVSPSAR